MIIICLFIFFISFLLIYKICPLNINSINNISINIYLYFIVLSLVGSIIIASSSSFYDLPSYFILDSEKNKAILVIFSSFFFYCLTVFFILSIFNTADGRVLREFKNRRGIQEKNSVINVFFLLSHIVTGVTIVYFLIYDKSQPLSAMLNGMSREEVYDIRIDGFSKDMISFLIKKLFLELSIITSLFYFLLRRSGIKKYTSLIVCVLFCFLQTEKAPVVILIISLLFAAILNGKKISFIRLLIILVVMLIFLAGMYYFLYESESLVYSFLNVLSRVFVQQISGVFLSIQYYGNIVDYDYGYNLFPRLFAFLDIGEGNGLIIAEQMASYYLPELYNAGSVKNINGLYVMDAWAAGGWWGCIIVSIILAIYSSFIYLFFLRKNKTPLVIAFYTYFSVFSISFVTSAGVALFSPFALIFFILFIILRNFEIKNLVFKD